MKRPAYLSRPWGLTAIFTALVLAGAFCWPLLPVDLLPRLPHPTLTVVTGYENAPPQEVDALITKRLESVLGTVAGVLRLESSSSEGSSSIRLVFDWGREMSQSAAEVREKLDSVADQLPRDADPPLVLHFDPSEAPVVTLALIGGGDPMAMREFAEYRLKTKLETAAGVAAVRLSGGLVPEVQVLADRARLVAFGVDLGLMAGEIEAANVNSPAGEIRFKGLEIPVRTVGRFTKPDQVLEVPLNRDQKQKDRLPGSLITVGDVAAVKRTHKDRTGFCLADNRPAILLSILKEPEGNTVEVSQEVRRAVDALSRTLPKGWSLEVVDDQAPFISESLSSLGQMVVFGGLLAFVVLWVYLRRLARAALVVLAAPVALAATMGFMRLFGVGLNLMSIGGLALGVGMLVDGSIVVLEAFLRHRDQGEEPDRAAVAALSEVRGGLICGAAATTVVLVPIMFLTGLAQRLFTDFAFTLIVSLAISLATAVWLLPALLVWRPGKSDPGRGAKAGRGVLAGAYGRLLGAALKIYPLTVMAGLILAAGAGWMLYHSGASLLPELSEGKALVQITLPAGSGVEVMESAVNRLVKAMAKTPGLKSTVVRAGVDPGGANTPGLEQGKPNQAFVTALFDPETWREIGPSRSMEALRKNLAAENGQEPRAGGGRDSGRRSDHAGPGGLCPAPAHHPERRGTGPAARSRFTDAQAPFGP